MKRLSQLNNVEKAKLLHTLLPEYIPSLIETTKHVADLVIENQQSLSVDWNNPILSLSMWVQLAEDTKSVIRRYDKQLLKSSSIFADQLFDGYNALFANHCIFQHAEQDNTPKSFKDAVALFYGRDI
jgi:hypothetical protein